MNKIRTCAELADYLHTVRSGKKIVFTNGCFDIIHIGHIRLLQTARSYGDILIVGVNSDSSVKRLKGEKRPVVCQSDRAEILAALECVSFVVIFDEDTPVELISVLKPDIHVKGGDYDMEKIPEAGVIHSYGGQMKRFDFVENHSSTDIIKKIISSYGA